MRVARSSPAAAVRRTAGLARREVSGGGLGLCRAEMGHGGLFGVRGEEALKFVGCDLEEIAVPVGVEGFQDEGDVGGVLGDAGAVGVAVVPMAGQDAGGVRLDDLAGLECSTVSGSPSGVKDSVPFAWRMSTSPVTWSRSKAPAGRPCRTETAL